MEKKQPTFTSNVISIFKDGLKNLTSNLGTDRDKASHSFYDSIVLTDNDLMNAYRYSWLARKIVDVVANDACRNWRTWQLDKGEVEKLELFEEKLKLR